MSIADKLGAYLEQQRVSYCVDFHGHTDSSLETVARTHLSPRRFAKAVVVSADESPVMVVVQAIDHVDLSAVGHFLGTTVDLVAEEALPGLFPDCETGAIPALGAAWGMRTLLDKDVMAEPQVSIEAGDHVHLLTFDREMFGQLHEGSEVGHFGHIL